jgi:hypothetical protein
VYRLAHRLCGGHVSSTFLYVGIVGIWAFFLVPRWLRRSHSAPQADDNPADYRGDEFAAGPAEGYAEPADGYAEPAEGYSEQGEAYPAGAPAAAEPRYALDEDAAGYAAWPDPGQPVSRTRGRMLQARRRLLVMLVLLTAMAAVCTEAKIISWWACIPPAGLLGIYLLLLRETALADAEQARRRAALELRAEAARQRAHEAWLAEDEAQQPSAEIIDISARVGDQLYDQYADATERAVGD